MRFTIPNYRARHFARLTQWHPWYAWYPVNVDGETWVWRETIMRRGIVGHIEVETVLSVMKGTLAPPRWHKPERRPVKTIIAFEYAPCSDQLRKTEEQ